MSEGCFWDCNYPTATVVPYRLLRQYVVVEHVVQNVVYETKQWMRKSARSEDRTHDLRITRIEAVIQSYETCALTS